MNCNKSCQNCIHYELCCDEYEIAHAENCNNFKDKSKYIELPCKVGNSTIKVENGEVVITTKSNKWLI